METFAFLQDLFAPLSLHPYVFIFIGMFFFGETVFFPALYLAFRGTLEVPAVIMLMIAATILADSVWYLIGRFLPRERAMGMMRPRARHVAEKLTGFFSTHRLKTLYLSKFVYGTRTVVQVLSGMYKTPFVPYMIVNVLGIISLAAVILTLAYLTNSTLEALTGAVHTLEIGFLVFLVILASVFIFIHQKVVRTWFQS